MRSGSMPERSTRALTTSAARSSAFTGSRLPPNPPTAVRSGSTIATRRMVCSLLSRESAVGDGALGGPAQLVAVRRVGDRDHPFDALLQRQPPQVGDPVLGDDDDVLGPRCRDG